MENRMLSINICRKIVKNIVEKALILQNHDEKVYSQQYCPLSINLALEPILAMAPSQLNQFKEDKSPNKNKKNTLVVQKTIKPAVLQESKKGRSQSVFKISQKQIKPRDFKRQSYEKLPTFKLNQEDRRQQNQIDFLRQLKYQSHEQKVKIKKTYFNTMNIQNDLAPINENVSIISYQITRQKKTRFPRQARILTELEKQQTCHRINLQLTKMVINNQNNEQKQIFPNYIVNNLKQSQDKSLKKIQVSNSASQLKIGSSSTINCQKEIKSTFIPQLKHKPSKFFQKKPQRKLSHKIVVNNIKEWEKITKKQTLKLRL